MAYNSPNLTPNSLPDQVRDDLQLNLVNIFSLPGEHKENLVLEKQFEISPVHKSGELYQGEENSTLIAHLLERVNYEVQIIKDSLVTNDQKQDTNGQLGPVGPTGPPPLVPSNSEVSQGGASQAEEPAKREAAKREAAKQSAANQAAAKQAATTQEAAKQPATKQATTNQEAANQGGEAANQGGERDKPGISLNDVNPYFKVLDPREYHLSSDLPLSIKELLYYFYWAGRIPPDCNSKIHAGLYHRRGKTTVKPPDKQVVCRLVLHLGPDEVYKLTEILGNKQLGESKEIVMANGSYLLLGKSDFTDYNVHVSGDPKVQFPSIIPSNYEEVIQEKMGAMGLSGGNKVKSDRIRRQIATDNRLKGRSTIRPRNYQRLTLIVDFASSKIIEDGKMLDTARFKDPNSSNPASMLEGLQIPDQLPTEIPAHIRASLPPGINPDIISKVAKDGKLSGLVTRVAKGVASDLKERNELTSENPVITGDLVSAIAASAMKNFDPSSIGDISSNIESLVEELGEGGLPLNTKAKRAVKRKLQKQRRRKRRGASRKTEEDSNGSNSPVEAETRENGKVNSPVSEELISSPEEVEELIGSPEEAEELAIMAELPDDKLRLMYGDRDLAVIRPLLRSGIDPNTED